MSKPISFTIITKDQPESCAEAAISVHSRLFREGDEIVILDTGSTAENLETMRQELLRVVPEDAFRIIVRSDLMEDFAPRIREWLGEDCLKEFVDYRGNSLNIRSFSEARQIATDACKNPIVFWIDSDDVFQEDQPGKLREIVDQAMGEDNPKLDAVFLEYLYAFGEDGKCITTLKRERFFFKDRYFWKGNCHETAIPKPGLDCRPVSFFADSGARIVHTGARSPHRISDIRNYVILRTEVEAASRGECPKDPRTLLYLANAARGLERFAEAHRLYAEFDGLSGSKEDRFNAAYYRAAMYIDPLVRRPFDALDQYWKCYRIDPQDARAHFGISRCYALLQRYQESMDWYEMGKRHPYRSETQAFAHDPTHYSFHADLIASNVAAEMGSPDKAMQLAESALRERPQFEQAQQNFEAVRFQAAGLDISKTVLSYLSTLKHGGPNALRVGRELCAEWDRTPPQLEERGISKIEPPDPRDANLPDLAIYCGHSPEEWGPDARKKGIGGSEKMILLLGRALSLTSKCKVSVYANIPFHLRGVDSDGILWRHWAEFDQKRPRHALICWRLPGAALMECPAKYRIIWNHDVQNPAAYSDEILACTDLIQFQSKYHCREFTDEKFNGKIWIARNAIERLPAIPEKSAGRNPKRVVFFSSPDRGILTALNIFAGAKQVDPELEFHVCYGVAPWVRKAMAKNAHRYIPDVNHEMSMDDYERMYFRYFDALGVHVHHRIGFQELSDLLRTCGVWLYPTRFPEISCMAAMEAQQHGVIPVCTRYAALEETVLPLVNEYKIEIGEDLGPDQKALETGVPALLKAAQVHPSSPLRGELAAAAEDAYNVDDLAEEWLSRLGLE